MADVNNLDVDLGVSLDYFHNGRCEQVLENIIDPMVMMIRLCQINGWMFLIFCENFWDLSISIAPGAD